MSEMILLDFDQEDPKDWNKWLWVELDIDLSSDDGDSGVIMVDYD